MLRNTELVKSCSKCIGWFVQGCLYRVVCTGRFVQGGLYRVVCTGRFVQGGLYRVVCTGWFVQGCLYRAVCTGLFVQAGLPTWRPKHTTKYGRPTCVWTEFIKDYSPSLRDTTVKRHISLHLIQQHNTKTKHQLMHCNMVSKSLFMLMKTE